MLNSLQVTSLTMDADENGNREEIYIKLAQPQEMLPRRNSQRSISKLANKLLFILGMSPLNTIETKMDLMRKLNLVTSRDFPAPSHAMKNRKS
jgi:hypothetical protein